MLHHSPVRHAWYTVNVVAFVFAFFGSFWIFVSVYASGPDQLDMYQAEIMKQQSQVYQEEMTERPRTLFPIIEDVLVSQEKQPTEQ